MLKIKTFVLVLLLIIVGLSYTQAYAQHASVKASIEPSQILIGQQATLQLDVVAPKGTSVMFPDLSEPLITGIEFLKVLPIDTLTADNAITYSQKYLITSFDSASYQIPYIPVLVGQDTLKSNELTLNVVSIDLSQQTLNYIDQWSKNPTDSIDFAQLSLSDIKPIVEPPFVWQDYLSYILITLFLILLLIAIAIGLYLYYRKKKKGYFFTPEVILPPHIVALNALDHIKEEKMWQHGREKEYYTDLTDILRTYIEDRFGTNAFERTSDEILASVRMDLETDSSLTSLKQVLKLADLVKFAKYTPLPDENDLSLMNAYLFINQTKLEETLQDETNITQEPHSKHMQSSDEENIDWNLSKEK